MKKRIKGVLILSPFFRPNVGGVESYLDALINQMPLFLKKGGYFITQHSNFSNIEKTENMLKELGFEVEVKNYEFPIGKTSSQRMNYFKEYLPKNCHPFKKECNWYQRIGVFLARRKI